MSPNSIIPTRGESGADVQTSSKHLDRASGAIGSADERRATFLIYSPFPSYSGGRETWLFNIARVAAMRRERLRIVSLATDLPFEHDLEPFCTEFVQLHTLRQSEGRFRTVNFWTAHAAKYVELFGAYLMAARSYLRKSRPSPLVCMNSLPEGLAARLAGVPYLVCVRGDVPFELGGPGGIARPPLAALERWVLRRAVRVFANGEDTARRLRSRGIDCAVIPNGVDVQTANPSVDDPVACGIRSWAAGRPLIVVLGTVRQVKGISLALATLGEMRAAGKDVVLACVGKGDPEPFKSEAKDLGVEEAVLFPGATQSPPAVLAVADVVLAVSGGSGMSHALLEAMAAARPIVALDAPQYRQLITDGYEGLLAGTAGDLGRAIGRILADGELARKLGGHARKRARSYDWRAVYDLLVARLGG